MGLERLLEETPEAYYWIGFIMADGYVSNRDSERCLIVALAEKDKVHLEKLSKFLTMPLKEKFSTYYYKDEKRKSKNYRLEKWDSQNIKKLAEKFDFKERKTYNPPNTLNIENNDFFLSFLIGFIDGDGCIDKQGCLHIQCHESWKNLLNYWIKRIYDIADIQSFDSKLPVCGSDKRDNGARIEVYNNYFMLCLKNKIIELDLPALNRKWERVIKRKQYNRTLPTNYGRTKEETTVIKNKILELLKIEFNMSKIARIMNVSPSYVRHVREEVNNGS